MTLGSRQPKWNIYEAVVLLDGYLETLRGDQPKAEIVRQISTDLRQMAVIRGIEIDDIYRNENGILFQMSSMESAYVGKTIAKPATKLFAEIVSLYRNNRSEYDRVLKEAKSMVGGKQTTEELFAAWLAQNAPSVHLSELYLCYSEIEAYCLRIKVLRKPLFETTDVDTVKKVQKTIMEDRLFKLSHKKQMKKIVSAAQYYTSFVKTLTLEAESTEIAKPAEKEQLALTSSNEVKKAEPMETKPAEKDITKYLKVILQEESARNKYGTTLEYLCTLLQQNKDLQTESATVNDVRRILLGADWAKLQFGRYYYEENTERSAPVKKKEEVIIARTKGDEFLLEKYPLLLKRVLSSLLYANDKTKTAAEIHTELERRFRLEDIETILNRASWSNPLNDGKYIYSSEIVSHLSKASEISKPAVTDESNPHTVDFRQSVSLDYTRPVKVSYFEEDLHTGASWTDTYVKLMSALYDDYADDIPVGKSFTGTGRIDFGNRELAKSMTAPKRIYMEMYLETNLSATDIVGKIKALLDTCRVDYENIVIEYEREDNTAHTVKKPQEQQKITVPEVSGNAPGESAFYSYLHDSLGMAETTCRSYVSAIRSAERFAVENRLTATRLYNCPAEEASTTAQLLFDDAEFLKYNEQQHNRFRAAVNKLLDYMGGATVEPRRTRSSFLTPSVPARPRPSYDTVPFEHVLEEHFVKGFRLGSSLDMKKFKRYYEEINEASVDKDDSTIEKIIRCCGIVHEDKVFLPKAMLSDDVKERLYAYIDSAFASGKTSIYFEALFREFSEAFLDHYIYNADMLCSYLAFECGDKYIIGKNQLFKEAGMTADPIDEVRTCLKEHGGPMETDNLCAVLAHLPRNTVVAILGSKLEFVRNSKGEYFHADVLALSEEELENIAELIEDAIRSHRFMSGTELMNAIRAKYPRTYEGYSSYSNIGWRDALKYKYGDRFSFRGNIISHNGETLSMSDVFAQLTRDADTITVDELLAFAKEMGTVIYFDAVYENALRIDEGTFVSKDRAAFQVKETDSIIDRFCIGNYVPLSSFWEFGIFPDAGFPWTVYLLECYAAFYSERYTLIHGGYNRNCAVGAVVKKNAGYESFDDLIVDVIADSGIPLKKANALDYLVKSGYIARRTYAGIEELLIRANAQRNRKGRP